MSTHEEHANGYTLTIERDDHASDPRAEYDHLGKMICFHRRYNLGDKHNFDLEEAQAICKSPENICLPLYLYDHSGITISCSSFSCPWDSGQVGFIYVSRAAIREEWKVKRISKKLHAQIIKNLRAEVEEYDNFLTGDVYCYQITDADGAHVDSCCGFFGYDYALEEARAQLKYFSSIQLQLPGIEEARASA